jgi:phage shock protein PspC (stress-responsive transcriptional regulator)
MQSAHTKVFDRPDTLFGVCEAIGQDFGIPALLPRLVFAGCMFWNMPVAIGAYLALGAVILVSRLLVRQPNSVAAPETVRIAAASEPELVEADRSPLPLAA